uniref:AAA-ATPase-like domain-containing protein n=1 Tax=Homalodisca liturata TaxID=320908 RepID=A0A1B6JWC6_9HEMI
MLFTVCRSQRGNYITVKNIMVNFSTNRVLCFFMVQVSFVEVFCKNITDSERFLLIRNSSAFIDKTWFLKKLFQYNFILLTAPPKFGKSMNMQMIKVFSDINNRRENIAKIFRTTNIFRDRDFVINHLCKYPVIYCSFRPKRAIETFGDVYNELKMSIANTFLQHEYITESSKLDNDTKNKFLEFSTLKVEDCEIGLKFLSEALFIHYSKKVILLIDDYDYSITQSLFNKELDSGKIGRLIFRLIDNSINLNEFLERAVVMGCVSYNLGVEYSGINLLQRFKFMETKDFTPYFGFTRRETELLLSKFGLERFSDKVFQWYGGYCYVYSDFFIYNPLSVLKFIKMREFNIHWILIKRKAELLEYFESYYQLNEFITRLVKNETVTIQLVPSLTIYDVENLKNEIQPARFSHEEDFSEFYLFLQILMESGYLTFAEKHTLLPTSTKVKYPNIEVKKFFEQILKRLSATYPDNLY